MGTRSGCPGTLHRSEGRFRPRLDGIGPRPRRTWEYRCRLKGLPPSRQAAPRQRLAAVPPDPPAGACSTASGGPQSCRCFDCGPAAAAKPADHASTHLAGGCSGLGPLRAMAGSDPVGSGHPPGRGTGGPPQSPGDPRSPAAPEPGRADGPEGQCPNPAPGPRRNPDGNPVAAQRAPGERLLERHPGGATHRREPGAGQRLAPARPRPRRPGASPRSGHLRTLSRPRAGAGFAGAAGVPARTHRQRTSPSR